MKKIKLNLGRRSYDILIGQMGFAKLVEEIKRIDIGRDAFAITNSPIYDLYGKALKREFLKNGFSFKVELVRNDERAKSWNVTYKLLKQITKFDIFKKVFMVAFGGGVVGDLTGFVASVYKRGVPYIQLPTTLLSQVDSAIGGKVAIDLSVAKNIVGSFYQPKLIFSELTFLKSLPHREIAAGLSEVIKYGIIKDRHLFEYIEKSYKRILDKDMKALEYIIYVSSAIKAKMVEEDEFDREDKRVILNFGHTIGHAIEVATGYSGRYNHGEAISIGMVFACIVSEELGLSDTKLRGRLESLLLKVGLPVRIRKLRLLEIYKAYQHDKKFIHGENRLVLPISIGKVLIKEGVPESIIIKALKYIIK